MVCATVTLAFRHGWPPMVSDAMVATGPKFSPTMVTHASCCSLYSGAYPTVVQVGPVLIGAIEVIFGAR